MSKKACTHYGVLLLLLQFTLQYQHSSFFYKSIMCRTHFYSETYLRWAVSFDRIWIRLLIFNLQKTRCLIKIRTISITLILNTAFLYNVFRTNNFFSFNLLPFSLNLCSISVFKIVTFLAWVFRKICSAHTHALTPFKIDRKTGKSNSHVCYSRVT